MHTRPTQTEQVIRHLKTFESITPMEALHDYSIMRLGARIFEAKRMGYEITTEIVTDVNRFGEPTHYAKYRMKKGEERK